MHYMAGNLSIRVYLCILDFVVVIHSRIFMYSPRYRTMLFAVEAKRFVLTVRLLHLSSGRLGLNSLGM